MNERLTQSQRDELSAWHDGEIEGPAAAEIEAKVAGDPVWAAAYREIADLEQTLDAWAVEPPAADLERRIIARIHQQRAQSRRVVLRLVGAMSGMAAAAAIVVAILLVNNEGKQTPGRTDTVAQKADQTVKTNLASVEGSDRMIVENLDFFQNYAVAANYDTLEAIDRIEDSAGGGM
ncbi:MAG: hypothetical protein ABFD92_07640 [Planctomycetaceae bacterium]|nr:hypothetical protein [Planctomycetaceae bacterium]